MTRPVLHVVDLFAGMRGWSRAFEARGHVTWSTDIETRFDVSHHADILQMDPDVVPFQPDVVLASPPCDRFSVMNINRFWTAADHEQPHHPKTRCKKCKGFFLHPGDPVRCELCGTTDPAYIDDGARVALRLVQRTLDLIDYWKPRFWVMENPVGKMRKIPAVQGLDVHAITYCKYGERRRKPTDLWGGHPPSWVPEPRCSYGADCHDAAPRGSATGTQTRYATAFETSAMRSKIPDGLSESLAIAMEHDYVEGLRGLLPCEQLSPDPRTDAIANPVDHPQLALFGDDR